MGFRFSNKNQQTVKDIFERIIDEPNLNKTAFDQQDDQVEKGLTDAFIKANTRFSNYQEFFWSSPVDLSKDEKLSEDDIKELDAFIQKYSDFKSWKALIEASEK